MTDIQFSHLMEALHAAVAVLAFGIGYLGGYTQ